MRIANSSAKTSVSTTTLKVGDVFQFVWEEADTYYIFLGSSNLGKADIKGLVLSLAANKGSNFLAVNLGSDSVVANFSHPDDVYVFDTELIIHGKS